MISLTNRWLVLFVGLFAVSCVFEDDDAPEPTGVFVKYFGESGSQSITDMIVNDQGHVVILGSQTLSENANRNAVIFEVDSVGNRIGSPLAIDISTQLGLSMETAEFPEALRRSMQATWSSVHIPSLMTDRHRSSTSFGPVSTRVLMPMVP